MTVSSRNAANPNPATRRSLSVVYAELERKRSSQKHYPKLPDFIAIPYMAMTTLISAYAALFGIYPILLFYAMWLPLAHFGGRLQALPTRDTAIGLMFSALCCLSALWSDYPSLTLYYGLELASTVITAIIIARIVRTGALIKGVILGTALVLAASLANGNYGADPFNGTYALVGLFGSKNTLGLFAEIGIAFSLLALCMRQNVWNKLLYGFFPLLLSAAALYMSRSAGSVLSLIIALLVIFAVYIVAKLPRSWRVPVFLLVALTLVAGSAACLALDWENAIFKSFGKDSTLTGRTDLWHIGLKTGMDDPLLGHGYSAFWVQGNPVAEQLWYQFGIGRRGGFHFHNLYVEMFVELGITGALLIAWLLLANLYASLRRVLKHGIAAEYILPLGVTLIFLIRSTIELDVVGGFSIGTLLMFSVLPRLAAYQREHNPENQSLNPP
jgi:exopolysaccharide production protein ExoQ